MQTTAAAAAGTAIGVAGSAPASAAPTGGRPNVVLILADDMGFSDIGRFGSEIPTPNIDRIAAEGATFTQFYNNARCCPTRASALTGLYPTQTGVGYMTDDHGYPEYQGRLNDDCVTIAEVLRDAGYRTAMSGKWHVGTWQNGVTPHARGFDRSYGPTGGKSSYFRPTLYRDASPIGRPTEPDYYLTDALADDAVDAIHELAGGDAPFFSYVAFTSPHWPLHAPEADVEQFRGRYLGGWDALRRSRFDRQRQLGLLSSVSELPPRDPDATIWDDDPNKSWQDRRMAVYAAQVHRMDIGVGRILDALEETGVRDDTLVLFLSDNGGCAEVLGKNAGAGTVSVDGSPVRSGNNPTIWPGPSNTYASYGLEWAHASNTPFTRYKHYTDEGGISTPLLASWPARVPAGRVVDKPLHLIDLAPTIFGAAGATYPTTRAGRTVPPLEGRSFQAVAQGTDPGGWTNGRPVFWEHEGNRAIRKGRYKLVARYDEPWRLYDVTRDRAETRNLADQRPETVTELDAEWQAWAARVRVRQWKPGTQYA
ncbi:arylsulfatase [Nocardioides iriomotensis]|nr:arylsulfatase [Nocardioides iriomotensis]